MRKSLSPITLLGLAMSLLAQLANAAEVYTPVPGKINGVIGSAAPSDAIILFDGGNLDAWQSAGSEEDAAWIVDEQRHGSHLDKAGVRRYSIAY